MSSPAITTVKLPLPEQVIAGRYRLLSSLGQGGMGLVFLAEQVGVGNRVAVKFLDPEPTAEDDTRVARFLREGLVGLQVKHPGAAQVLDLGRDEALRLYLVFELAEGVDLRDLLRDEGRLSFDEARSIALKVAEVLHFAHERGIVHRDVKPENVRVRRDLAGMHVKVLDFGIARLVKDTGVRLTAEGSLAGTPRYMAPEQVRDGTIDGRTDQYALGLMLYEMLAGVPAFTGRNIAQVLEKQVRAPLPSLSAADARLASRAVDDFLQRACAKSIDERFPTMADFAQALHALPVDARAWPAPGPTPPAAPRARADGLSDTLLKAGVETELELPAPEAAEPRPARSAPAAPPAEASGGETRPDRPAAGAPAAAPSPASAAPELHTMADGPAARRDRPPGAGGATVRGQPVPLPPGPARRRRWPLVAALAVAAAGVLAWWLVVSAQAPAIQP